MAQLVPANFSRYLEGMKFHPLLFGFVLLFTGTALAGERTAGKFHAEANVVLINATVLDRNDRPVRGLARSQFRVFEDKTEETVAYFSEEDVPVSLTVVFDVSGSMDSKMADMRAALDTILKGGNDQDEFSLVTFADRPQVAIGWDTNPADIQNQLLLSRAHGQTSLLDALETGLKYMKKARNPRKAMLLFSDGGDNYSRASEREVLESLAETGVQIYAVDTSDPAIFRTTPEEIAGPDLLERLCDSAGGRYFRVDGKREIAAAAKQIARELHSQYVIGYVPSTTANDGRFHSLRVQVKREEGTPRVSVFWRRGYRAAGN